ncbi:MAG: translation initiation factor IF-2 [Erysipelothrix sp.]|nr:translation initiation factor IF-2 [Erysipelothrix sp.]
MNRNNNNRNRNYRKKRRNTAPVVINYPTTVSYYEGITVGALAKRLERKSGEIIKIMFKLGSMVTINDPLASDLVELIALELNVTATLEVDAIEKEMDFESEIIDNEEDLVERAPVVTIMGHVDHGKTSLLDTIRKTDVTDGEFGGITQHIGAYQVKINDKLITFLDTPGHEAFTAMRARGTKVTDIVVIVVAADDGVMPQTKEAIDHALVANSPIIVAINKIDKPGVNTDRIISEMSELGLVTEAWGGNTMFLEVSAKTGQGVEALLESIQLLAEVSELKANPDRLASGTAIEAELDKGRGVVASLLVQNGTLHHGDYIVVGTTSGRIRKMTDHHGNDIKVALPSTPVEILGLNEVPIAGDSFRVFEDEKTAKEVASRKKNLLDAAERGVSSAMSLEDLAKQILEGNMKEIPVIVKSDVQGTAEAVRSSLEKIDVEGVRVNVLRAQAGGITESDVMLAHASNAIIFGFNVRPNANVRSKAAEDNVEIRLHNVIYKLVEEMEAAMKGMLDPVFEEVIFGQAEVRETYKVSKIGTIAGCMVIDGKMVRNSSIRLIRDDIVIYDGEMASLKRFNDDAKEVQKGFECGITIKNFNDLKIGDIIESHGEKEVAVV